MKNQAKIYPLINKQPKLLLKRVFSLFLLFIIFVHVEAALQTGDGEILITEAYKVKGKVTSEDEAMPGVNVYLKDTQIGTLTDKNGEFSFPRELKNGDILVFSFLGYETYEYTVTKNTPEFISVSLKIKSILITGALDEKNQPKGINKLIARVKSIF